jgi:hypothetical protein
MIFFYMFKDNALRKIKLASCHRASHREFLNSLVAWGDEDYIEVPRSCAKKLMSADDFKVLSLKSGWTANTLYELKWPTNQ